MAQKTIYKEPGSYFNDAMKKTAAEWERKNTKSQGKKPAKSKSTGKKK